MGQVRRDIVSSFRLVVDEEGRLFGASLLGLVVYGVWVGVTGAALTYVADVAEIGLTPRPWNTEKTALAAVAVLAWVLVPAGLAVRLLADRLTNASDNLAQHYRYRHPAALLVPPLCLLVVAAGAALALGEAPWPLLVVLVAGALFFQVRVVAYSYRVFRLSYPPALHAVAFLTALALAVALLTGGAIVAGRQATLLGMAAGLGSEVGVDGVAWFVGGAVTVADVRVPTVVAATVGVPVALSGLYLAGQAIAGGVARYREPDVRRSELRTGQRYPEFARPTTDAESATTRTGTQRGSQPSTADATSGGSSDADATGASTGNSIGPAPDETSGADGTAGEEETVESVSNTRVYTPPGDGFEGDTESDDSEDTSTAESEEAECPSCGETYDADRELAFCPNCGESLR